MKPGQYLIAFLGIVVPMLSLHAQTNAGGQDEEVRKKFLELALKADEKRRKEELQAILATFAQEGDVAKQRTAFSKLLDLKVPADEEFQILQPLLDHKDREGVAYFAMVAIGMHGKRAKPAVPKILAIFKDSSAPLFVREAAAATLGQIGDARPAVIEAMTVHLRASGLSDKFKLNLIESLGALGLDAQDAIPVIERYLKDPDLSVQVKAYYTAGKLRGERLPSLADLRKAKRLEWAKADGAYPAVMAIEAAGPQADFTVPLILQAIEEDPPTYIYCVLMRALGHAGANDPKAVRAMLDAIPIKELPLRQEVLRALKKTDISREEVVVVFADGMGDIDPFVQYQCALALRPAGPKAKKAVPALVNVLKKVDSQTSSENLGAFLELAHAIGPAAATCREPILDMLPERAGVYKDRPKMEVHMLRGYLLVTLAEIGITKEALPFVLDVLATSDNRMVQQYASAARAAGALGKDAREAVPFLMRALDPKFADRGMVLESFPRHGTALLGLDLKKLTSARIEAIRALAKIGPDAKAALPRLTQMVDDPPIAPAEYYPPYNDEARKAIQAIRGK